MNHHAKRYMRDLESLGFERDHTYEGRHGVAYRHPNDPTQVLKVFDAMTDNSITAGLRKANKIADTGWSGPRQPQTIKERATITRRRQTAQQKKIEAERAERAKKAEAEHEARQREARERAAYRDISSLMQPGYGR